MKRQLHTSHANKRTLDAQPEKHGSKSQAKNKLAVLTIDNTCLVGSSQKSLGNSTTRMTLTSSLKRSSFYRRFMNHSASNNHHRRQSPKDQSHNRQSSLERYPKPAALLLSKCQNIENYCQTPQEDVLLKKVNLGKIKSFESFLKNKKKQTEKMFLNQFKRRKFSKTIQSDVLVDSVGVRTNKNDTIFSLSGMGIKKLKKQGLNEKNKLLSESMYTSNQFLTVDDSRSIQVDAKMRSIQSEYHSSKHSDTHSYVKYYFKEDQGYCPFNKVLFPLSTKKQVLNNKRILYFNLHKDLRRSKLSQPGKANYPTNNIEGWIVSTEQEEDISSNVNIPR